MSVCLSLQPNHLPIILLFITLYLFISIHSFTHPSIYHLLMDQLIYLSIYPSIYIICHKSSMNFSPNHPSIHSSTHSQSSYSSAFFLFVNPSTHQLSIHVPSLDSFICACMRAFIEVFRLKEHNIGHEMMLFCHPINVVTGDMSCSCRAGILNVYVF